MDTLTPLITTQRYGAVSNGTQNATVYAFAQCMKDLSQSDCNLCIAQCKTQILTCLPFQKGTRGGRLFFDGCYLRYDDYNFFNESLSNQDKVVCGNGTSNFGGVNSSIYDANALELVRNLSVVAVRNDGFSVGFVNRKNVTVYGLAQCWEFVTGSNCRKCLDDAVTKIGSCKMKQEGRVLNSGCYLRYSPQKFYDNSTNVASAGNHGQLCMVFVYFASVFLFGSLYSYNLHFNSYSIWSPNLFFYQYSPGIIDIPKMISVITTCNQFPNDDIKMVMLGSY